MQCNRKAWEISPILVITCLIFIKGKISCLCFILSCKTGAEYLPHCLLRWKGSVPVTYYAQIKLVFTIITINSIQVNTMRLESFYNLALKNKLIDVCIWLKLMGIKLIRVKKKRNGKLEAGAFVQSLSHPKTSLHWRVFLRHIAPRTSLMF